MPSTSAPEPITPDPPEHVKRPLLTQWWRELAFVHWTVDPERLNHLMPEGVRPDTMDGVGYLGLVAFRMCRVGVLGTPGIPYLGDFPETNIRLYSVDRRGRRGVVFLSLDASRLIPVLLGRAVFGLPYVWSRMSVRHNDSEHGYVSRRHRGGTGATRLRVTAGEEIARPTELEHFLTARWGMHTRMGGSTVYVPNRHPRWRLHRARLRECDTRLPAAAGVEVTGDPVSVLYAPGVPVRFGKPLPV